MKIRMLVLALLSVPVFAAPPAITNGTVQPLASLSRLPANGWVGYMMQTAQPLSVSCCDTWSSNGSWSRCDTCRLDKDGGFSINRRDPGDVGPVGSTQLALLARIEDGVITRLRMFSPDCTLDAAGNTISWVDSVSERESIAFLRSSVDRGAKRARDSALLGLSLHAGALDTLIDVARNNADRDIRGKALFWLSQQAGRKAASTLRDAVDNDPEASVREKAVFGISQLPNDESIPLLIDLMKNHRTAGVRKKAAFWLGQKNDPRALAAIEEILTK